MKSTKFWIILITGVLVVCAAVSAVIFLWRGSGTVANIYQDGKLIRRIDLDTVTSPYEFVVQSETGGENTVSVEPGQIRISQANCPDQVCVDTGWIHDGVLPIVCLPHQLVIEIDGNHTDIDGAVQ